MFVHELFRQHARSQPESPAITGCGQTLTYRDMDAWSDAFAERLVAAGAGPERLVCMIAPRSAAAVACLLGVLKAGAAYVPIDPDYPPERIRYILDDVNSSLAAICHLGPPPEHLAGPTLIDLASVPAMPESVPAAPALETDNLAYVVYTSGSTGSPKGVMIEHGALSAVVPQLVAAYRITPADRVLHMAPLGFDTSISEILRTLCAGACLCVVSPEVAASPDFLMRLGFLKTEKVTKAVLPAALLRVMRRIDLPHLDTLVTTGEPCSLEMIERWAPGRRLLNAYGSTEGTFASTIKQLLPGGQDIRPTVGRPIPTCEVFVVGEDGSSLVPDGEVGEIHLAGKGVARGYFGRPDLTRERFVANRWGSMSERAFRTGDLGRWLPNGELECLGRQDHQVKVQGARVDLGEVEAALRRHDRVRDAVVTTVERADGATELVGHLLIGDAAAALLEQPKTAALRQEQDAPALIAELRRHLGQILPRAALPTHLRFYDTFPLNAHGKVDRSRLDDLSTVPSRR